MLCEFSACMTWSLPKRFIASRRSYNSIKCWCVHMKWISRHRRFWHFKSGLQMEPFISLSKCSVVNPDNSWSISEPVVSVLHPLPAKSLTLQPAPVLSLRPHPCNVLQDIPFPLWYLHGQQGSMLNLELFCRELNWLSIQKNTPSTLKCMRITHLGTRQSFKISCHEFYIKRKYDWRSLKSQTVAF